MERKEFKEVKIGDGVDIIQESFTRLFPTKTFLYKTEIEYNRRLSRFNANISLKGNILSLRLNLEWKDIDDEIKIGLCQHLLLKIFKQKKQTSSIDLYTNFIRNIPLLTTTPITEPVLQASFERVNTSFFNSSLPLPHIEWGKNSSRKLASYNYHNDTVRISSLFQNSSQRILDYLMYHELLHKHFQFKHNNNRSSYHTKEFKDAESLYPQQKSIEQEIEIWLKGKKKPKSLLHKPIRFLKSFLS